MTHSFRSLFFLITAVLLPVFFSGCASGEMKQVRLMPISHVDLARVPDGSWTGDFSYGHYTYEVQVSVKAHTITDVRILKNRATKYAKTAEQIAERIVKKQKNDVDAVSGATTTSKALLKAAEKALEAGAHA